jgi:centromeric protein E
MPIPTTGGATAAFAERQQNKGTLADDSPVKIELGRVKGHLLLGQMPEEGWSLVEDMSFDEKNFRAGSKLRMKDVLAGKENAPA